MYQWVFYTSFFKYYIQGDVKDLETTSNHKGSTRIINQQLAKLLNKNIIYFNVHWQLLLYSLFVSTKSVTFSPVPAEQDF